MACDVHEGAADNLGHFVILGINPLNKKKKLNTSSNPGVYRSERAV